MKNNQNQNMKIELIYTYGGIDAPNQDRAKENVNAVRTLDFDCAWSAEAYAQSCEWPHYVHSIVCGEKIVANPHRSHRWAHGASPFSERGTRQYVVGANKNKN